MNNEARVTLPVLFCAKCGDCLLDQNGWSDPETVVIQCYRCRSTISIKGFVIGRVFSGTLR